MHQFNIYFLIKRSKRPIEMGTSSLRLFSFAAFCFDETGKYFTSCSASQLEKWKCYHKIKIKIKIIFATGNKMTAVRLHEMSAG